MKSHDSPKLSHLRRFKSFCKIKRKGLTLLEVAFALTIIAIVMVASIHFITTIQTSTVMNQDRSFAIQKALLIINELRAYAEENEESGGVSTLDAFDNGTGTSPLLTIDDSVTEPDDIVSGNVQADAAGRWRYSRQILIQPFASAQATNARIIRVRIFLTEPGSNTGSLLADISSVVTAQPDTVVSKQVFDVYLLNIENVPGWWISNSTMRTLFENAMVTMNNLNPGVEFRPHWISKLAYGRDLEYKPFFNVMLDSVQPINYVYFYPGTLPLGSALGQYYAPENIMARYNMDGITVNDFNSTGNPYPYALADQYNHAMRYPEELALYQNRLNANLEDEGLLTYRLLLDDIIANPGNYRNAIFINLHGEMLPMPPLRNYSDAAKDPVTFPQWRVVTHPEKLRFDLTEDLRLRVYAYLADPSIAGNNYMTVPVSIVIPGMNLTVNSSDVIITAIKGGTDQDPQDTTADNYTAIAPAPNTFGTGSSAYRMYATLSYDNVNNHTIIRLFYTPLRASQDANGSGLNPAYRLYGMDYIPCPVEAANDFSQTLIITGSAIAKNTARWIIQIPATVVNRELGGTARVISFDTRIGDNLSAGVMWPTKNKPTNRSTTYIWRYSSISSVPFSERYQFQGDPRHCPYADVKSYHGYNWFFDNFRNSAIDASADWGGFSKINSSANDTDGWHGQGGTTGEMLEIDVPRFYQFLRTALLGANVLFNNITGYSFSYIGLGNEIGYDAAMGFPDSIPVSAKPFNGGTGTRNEDSIKPSIIGAGGNAVKGGVKYIRENASPYWWSMPWLGENYPDSVYATQWTANGNLNTGSGANTFVRVLRRNISTSGTPQAKANSLPRGTSFYTASAQNDVNLSCVRYTGLYGCTSFYNMGTSASTFRHSIRDNTSGTITSLGQEMSNIFNQTLVYSEFIDRPFRTDNSWGAVPTEFNSADYSALRCGGTTLWNDLSPATRFRFFNHEDGTAWGGSAIMRLRYPAANPSTNQFIFVAENGLSRLAIGGNEAIAQYVLMSSINGLMLAGLPAPAYQRIAQLPRIEIKEPNIATQLSQPDEINLNWETVWKRWDREKYSTLYADDFAEIEGDLRYALLYSLDSGGTWKHMVDDSDAALGKPNTAIWIADQNDGANETYIWDVSDTDKIPGGNYIIRVEAYRNNVPSHYSYHVQKILIER